jgi:hypothetical protein
MSKLPADLPWRDFVRVLTKLNYTLYKSGSGSARTFRNDHRDPDLPTFHEPHGKNGIPTGTLAMYLRILKLERDDFLQLLNS